MNDKKNTLFVDLDGSLISTDLLIESLLLAIRENLFLIFILPFWLIKGKAYLKHQLSLKVTSCLNIENLRYNREILSLIDSYKKSGSEVVLCTASNTRLAEKIANYLKIFDMVIASDDKINNSGEYKLKNIKNFVGNNKFDYIGDSIKDLPVWKECSKAYVVSNSRFIKKKLTTWKKEYSLIPCVNVTLKIIAKQLRVHQWIKNILIFLPLVVSHNIDNIYLFSNVILGLVVFSFLASSTYIINDLFDLQNDRCHKTKRNRPLASGAFPVFQGILLSIVLMLSVIAISTIHFDLKVQLLLLFYAITSILYSFHLKKYPILDVSLLTIFYISRIMLGAYIINVIPSFWFIGWSIFFFFGLAILKRFCEIKRYSSQEIDVNRRGYIKEDLIFFGITGLSISMNSILLLTLYLNSTSMYNQYNNPDLLWGIVPITIYWTTYLWFSAFRGKVHDDPVVFVLKDLSSLVCACISLLLIIVSY